MTERALREWMSERGLSIMEGSTHERIGALSQAIRKVLPRKSVSDRTCQQRIVEWTERQINSGRWNATELLKRVIDALLESSGPTVRNPNAMFMSILKSELGYRIVSQKSK